MRTHGKRDANQAAIVAEMRARGWLVLDLASVGGGCPDLLTFSRYPHGWRLTLVEVKGPKGTLTPDQQRFQLDGWPVSVVRSVDDLDQI
jgi:hypothetical protein